MKEDNQGRPALGPSARMLGVRPGIDTVATKPNDVVYPSQGGMSVSPGDPLNLPTYRRPPIFNGTGKDPVWIIEDTDLANDLSFRLDPANINHGFIEPANSMTLDEYRIAIEQTQPLWQKITTWPISGGSSDEN